MRFAIALVVLRDGAVAFDGSTEELAARADPADLEAAFLALTEEKAQ